MGSSLRQVCSEGNWYWRPTILDPPQCGVLLGLEEKHYSTTSGASHDFIDETTTPSHSTNTTRIINKPDSCRRNNGRRGEALIGSEQVEPCLSQHCCVPHLECQTFQQQSQYCINSSHAQHIPILRHRQWQQSMKWPFADLVLLQSTRRLNAQELRCSSSPNSSTRAMGTYHH